MRRDYSQAFTIEMAGLTEFDSDNLCKVQDAGEAGHGVASNGHPKWLSFIPVRQMNWGPLRTSDMPGDHPGRPDGPDSDGPSA